MIRVERHTIHGLPPELMLVTACLRARHDPAWQDRFALLLQSPLDWDQASALAARHGVTPLLHRELERLGSAHVPLQAIETLRRNAGHNAAHQMMLVSELRDLLDRIRRLGVVAVPCEGPALAASLYGNFALREEPGLDLMVRRRDVPAVTALLLGRGYREAGGSSRHVSMRRADGLTIELRHAMHRGLVDPATEEAWSARLARGSLLGREVRCLAPEDLLRMLCMAGWERGWQRLIWASDVAELLHRHPALAWERLWEEAERFAGARELTRGLEVAHGWLGVELPHGALRGLHRVPAVLHRLDAPWRALRDRAARWSRATRHAG